MDPTADAGGQRPRERRWQPFRLVAVDLDGTLARSDGSVSRRNVDALADLRRRDVQVVIATGRPPRTVRAVAAIAGLGGLAVCANGALVYDLDRQRVRRHSPLPASVAGRLVAGLREAAPGIRFAAELGLRYAREPEYLPTAAPPDDHWVADASEFAGQPVTKLLAQHPTLGAERLRALALPLAAGEAEATFASNRFLECSAAGVSKAGAVAALCAEAGIDPAEVLAVGDMPNDVQLLRWAGVGAAVANAHAEVAAVADTLTAANDDDGVARMLEALGLAGAGASPAPPADLDACVRHAEDAFARLLGTAEALGAAELLAASGLPGWSRAHVLAHLARNADGQRRMLEGILAGWLVPQYPGGAARRAEEIERGAQARPDALLADLRASQRALAHAWRRMSPADWTRPTVYRVAQRPAWAGVLARWRELAIHHVDLDAGYGARHWPEAFVDALLDDVAATVPGRLPAGVAVRLVERAGGRRLLDMPPAPSGSLVTISGRAADLLAWMLGRPAAGLRVADHGGPVSAPPLRAWA